MQANVGRTTTPEQRIRAALRAAGLRFRTDSRPEKNIRCTADITFPKAKVCVFIDGCFWHGCPRHFTTPKTNRAWWKEKIAANRDRDARQARLLRKRGWRVLRVWEHQTTESAGINLRRLVVRLGRLVDT
jgi:DNA mismatch endonuclease (patch repair protein)